MAPQSPLSETILPHALESVPDVFANAVPKEPFTVCGRHGAQSNPHCEECDKFFPEAVEARKIAATPVTLTGFSLTQVQKMINDAVKEAVSFERWKSSPEGQAAAIAAPTSQANPEAKDAAKGGMDVSNTPETKTPPETGGSNPTA